MKKTITSVLIIACLASCGNNEKSVDAIIKGGDLSEIKAKKAELVKTQQDIEAKLAQLESAIAKQDPSQTLGDAMLVEVDTIRPQTFKNYVAAQGTITSEQNIMVSPEIPGVITKVLVNEGDRVSRGQLMATMDASGLESQLQQVKASFILAETTYERTARLWKQNIGSEMQLLQAEANKESLQAQMDAIKSQIANTRMVAPVNGVVDDVNLKLGEMASPGAQGIRVVNMSDLKARANVADRFAASIKKGDEIQIFLPDLNDTITEKVSFVSQAIDPKSRTITIEANLDNKNKQLKPNMVAKLNINNYTAQNAIVVPSNVLLNNSDRKNSFYLLGVVKDGDSYVAKRYDVEIGKQYGGMTEILSGLPKDAVIVSFGFGNLTEGQKLRINEN